MAYIAPLPAGKPGPSGDPGNNDPGGSPSGGFAAVGLQTPTGVDPLTAALLPGDKALTMMTKWLLAWAIFGVILIALDRTRLGHAALYYALVLMVFFTAVVEYKWFAAVMAPITDSGSARPPISDRGLGDSGNGGVDSQLPPSDAQANQSNAGADQASQADQLGQFNLMDQADVTALTVQPF